VAPTAFASALRDLDPALQLRSGPRAATPPVAHFWFATRPYGASVEVTVTEAVPGPAQLEGEATRVATLRLELGEPAPLGAAVVVGAAAAELLLAEVLRLAPMPAVTTINWTQPDAPQQMTESQLPDAITHHQVAPPSGLLAEVRGDPKVWQALVAAAERGYPLETCGLVVREPAGCLKAIECPNLQDQVHAIDPHAFPRSARTAYQMDERWIARSAGAGETLLAIWHSHCDAGAYFSAGDVRCAAPGGEPLFPGIAYLVLSVLGGAVRDVGLFRFDSTKGAFVAEAKGDSAV
jgi:proteasome lid subunit RPN8/RPN11